MTGCAYHIMTPKDTIPAEAKTTHCGRDCESCLLLPYPQSRYCNRERGKIYRVEGECGRCGHCCIGEYFWRLHKGDEGKCKDLRIIREDYAECMIQDTKEGACIEFPVIDDFLQDNVPPKCSFKLVQLER